MKLVTSIYAIIGTFKSFKQCIIKEHSLTSFDTAFAYSKDTLNIFNTLIFLAALQSLSPTRLSSIQENLIGWACGSVVEHWLAHIRTFVLSPIL